MKKILLSLFVTFGLVACTDNVNFENTSISYSEIVIDFDDETSINEIALVASDLNIALEPNSPMFGKTKIVTVVVNNNQLNGIESYLESRDDVESAGINYRVRVDVPTNPPKLFSYTDKETFPNDPLYDSQWNLTMIGIEDAWEASGHGVTVAVIDTGISEGTGKYGRVPDLGETCFDKGFNFVDNDEDPYDMFGHGTHVGGTIAQSTNNNLGVAGVAYNACLMPIKVLTDAGWGSVADIAEGIRWAADNGAHVINLSLGGGPYSPVMEGAVEYAYDKNVFLACAAGNGSKAKIEYPAGYEGCHAISAVNRHEGLAFYSSYGESENGNKLFISAPGGDTKNDGPEGGILQDTIERGHPARHGYYPFQGTSMATPHVAGVAALVIDVLGPEDYDVDEVADILAESASDKGDFERYGHGILNAEAAVEMAIEQTTDKKTTSTLSYILMLLGSVGLVILMKNR